MRTSFLSFREVRMIVSEIRRFYNLRFRGIKKNAPSIGQMDGARAYSSVGVTCQISSAYWRMVRSEENFAPLATFIMHFLPKAIRSA